LVQNVALSDAIHQPPRTEAIVAALDRAIARLAADQHGVVALRQLRALGLSGSGVRTRAARGALHRIHRGAYAVGHPTLTAKGRWAAAVLACGPGAALSHRSAAALWGIRATSRAAVEVTVPGQAGRGQAGIQAHRCSLDDAERTAIDGIPCTTLARTLLDLAEVIDRDSLEQACERAEGLELFDLSEVERVLTRAVGRQGAPLLRAAIPDSVADTAFTRSDLERRFLELSERAGLPRPLVNSWVALKGGGYEVDFLWPEHRLIVELDGWSTHGNRRAFRRDRRRDVDLEVEGYTVLRLTWEDVVLDGPEVVRRLRRRWFGI
jgi:Protein of unknown function (DUF559)/Transcriptional regulator, AbiEi antitoxin